MKNHLRLLVLAICLCCSSALAGDSWFGGGGYDGYDRKGLPVSIGYPVVNNANGATNVTTTNAWLNGMLLSTGSAPTMVYVYWGPTDGVTNKANWANTNSFGEGIEGQTFTTNVSVNPNVTYAYRFYATNTAGEDGWAIASASFLTPSVPALDSGSGASPLSYTTATLNGNLTAGISATVTIYWGANTNSWSGTNNLGSRNVGAFLTTVSGLTPGTLYYYRCYGTNAYGDGWADTRAFTTLVQTVVFSGGSYDGYDRQNVQMAMGGGGGSIFLFY